MTNVPAGAAFFAAVRPLFGGKLSQSQVDGLKVILEAWDTLGDNDDRKLAYILSTAFHETGQTMQPVRETFADSDSSAKQRLTKAFNAGKLGSVKKDYWSGGFFGRGLVQLTHEANYRKAGEQLGIDLVADPSLALDPKVSAAILVKGMRDGWFTGKKLSDYIGATADYRGARRIVNGTDRAGDLADYAETFEAALRAARHAQNEVQTDELLRRMEEELQRPAEPLPEPESTVTVPQEPETPASEPPEGWDWGKIGLAAGITVAVLIGVIAILT